MLDSLHHHDVGEDEGVWPRTLAKRPDLQPMVDEMEAEHEALAAASHRLRAAAGEFAGDGSDASRRALAEAVTAKPTKRRSTDPTRKALAAPTPGTTQRWPQTASTRS